MIIIPDIHGRVFWKDAVKDKNEKVIFLGDYVDPYPGEKLSLTGTIDNLEEIIEYKKSNPSQVILLLGNHDFMYMDSEHNRYSCRHDFENEPKITKILLNSRDQFQMAYITKIREKDYVFSHSGILKDWLEEHKDLFGEYGSIPESVEVLNNLYHEWNPKFIQSLLEVSSYRGGWSNVGSMIWADLREHRSSEDKGVYQIFGHTQLKDQPVISENFADLDCRRSFVLNEETGEIEV